MRLYCNGMKTTSTLKEFRELSSGVVHGEPVTAPVGPKPLPKRTSDSVRRFAVQHVSRAEQFREMLRRRETTPFVSAIPYHRWGINE
jgi:hypothetical protein